MINDEMISSNRSAHDSIVKLCYNNEELESELISQLQAILQDNPNAVHEKDSFGRTLLHRATRHRSPEFSQVLISLNKELVRTADNRGMLPFYHSCEYANINTAKYLFRLYPESISIPGRIGQTPLHVVLFLHYSGNKMELVKFLLHNDQGAISTPDHNGRLPLHIATLGRSEAVVKLVFNAYPNAIHTEDNRGYTPLNFARSDETEIIKLFFDQQIELERQARIDRTPDNNGQLPIHRALRNVDASLGGIKLMLAANQASIALADNQVHTPLHIACHVGNLDAAKFLLGVNNDSLQATDTRGNLPLHLACANGNCEVISYILNQSSYGVTIQNSNKKTPIELLLFESECDRDNMYYVEAIRCLFQVNPEDTLEYLRMARQ